MDKNTLLKQCAELGIKCKSRITNSELFELLKINQSKQTLRKNKFNVLTYGI